MDEGRELTTELTTEITPWPEVEERAVDLFKELIKIDTQNFGEDGTETEAVTAIAKRFDAVGISYEIVEPKPGRGNIVARINGDGSSGKGALCLSAHLDTVKAPKENWEAVGWKHNPFAAVVDDEDGCLYGRGAIDMKNMAAMSATLMCYIKENKITLSRDLIFVGLADEERSDSKYGIKHIVQNKPDLVEADIVLTELGGVSLHMNDIETFSVMVGEKGVAKIKITASGPGGHSSTYHKNNPIAVIGAVADTLTKQRLPLHLVPSGVATIKGISSLLPFAKRILFNQLLSPRFSGYIVDYILSDEQYKILVPLLHNTANPTIIQGGNQANQIPTEASIIVDGRILPGLTVEDIQDDIKSVIGPQRFEPRVSADGEDLPPELHMEVLNYRYSYEQDLESPELIEVIDVIRKVVGQRANGAPTFANLIPGATDLTFYSQHPTKTPICLGFTPARLPPSLKLATLFHGVNERMPVEGFKWGIRVLADVVGELCNAKL